MKRRLLLGLAVVATALACSLIVGLSIHIVDTRNNRAEVTAAKVQTLAEANLSICHVQVTGASEVNAVVIYIKSIAPRVNDADTRKFILGLPVATAPNCRPLKALAYGSPTTTTGTRRP